MVDFVGAEEALNDLVLVSEFPPRFLPFRIFVKCDVGPGTTVLLVMIKHNL